MAHKIIVVLVLRIVDGTATVDKITQLRIPGQTKLCSYKNEG
jgi:hypothetical protein